MTGTNLFDEFYVFVLKMYRKYCVKKSYYHYIKLFKKNNIPIKKLSAEQKKEVDKIYGG